jgi:ABC-2 type transport system permease protein
VNLFLHQLRSEQLIFWRNRESAVFLFIFPIMLFVLLGSFYTDDTILGFAAVDVLLAGMIGYGAANTGFAGQAIMLVVRREFGILKRLRSTPLPAPVYFAAALGSTLIVFTLQTIVLFALGELLYGTRIPEDVFSLVLLVILGAVAFMGLGIGLAALIRSAEGASAVVNVVLLPMAFLSGSFGVRDYPAFLDAIADVLPLKHYIELVVGASLAGESPWSNLEAVAIVAAWGVAGAVLAARRFTWEPRDR